MTEIRFYQLQNQTQLQVLPALLSKAFERGHRIVVKLRDSRALEEMNDYLWAYSSNSFLPHGSESDGKAALQPIWLTIEDENPNGADVLILCAGVESGMHADFPLCCEMLDGQDEAAKGAARMRWKAYKERGFDVTYWQQDDRGGWNKS